MLEKSTNDAANADRLAHSRNAWSKAADPSNDEVDHHASVGGGKQSVDDVFIDECIDLRDDPRRPASASDEGLAVDARK